MLTAWHTDLGVLRTLCDIDPACQGFSSLGVLKANVTSSVSAPGTTLYVKKAKSTPAAPYLPGTQQARTDLRKPQPSAGPATKLAQTWPHTRAGKGATTGGARRS